MAVQKNQKKAIFFDRDGIIIKAYVVGGYPYPPPSIDAVRFEDGIFELLDYLKRNYYLFILTNQPDVKRGIQSKEEVEKINNYIKSKLPITEIYTCYHDNEDRCNCRKPKTGLYEQAKNEYPDIDFFNSWTIGDRRKDIVAGNKMKTKTIFVDYNYKEEKPCIYNYKVDCVGQILRLFKEIIN